MKKILAGFMTIALSVALVCPVFAGGFVNSITYKPAPELIPTVDEDGKKIIGYVRDEDGNILSTEYHDCIVITPVSEAKTSDRIPKDAADLLLKVFEELSTGEKKLSEISDELNDWAEEILGEGKDADNLVVKDMFDATALCEELKTYLPVDGNTIDLTFDVGIDKDTPMQVMVYVDGEWQMVEKVVNNGDGTVTITFEDICPIMFLVPEEDAADSIGAATTGDMNASQLVMWSVLAGASLLAMVAAVVVYRRKLAE